MPTKPENRNFSFTMTDQGEVATIRGVSVPGGSIAAPDLVAISPASREVTPRAIELTAGIFEFAKRGNRPEPNEGDK